MKRFAPRNPAVGAGALRGLLWFLPCLCLAVPVHAAGRQMLTGHVPAAVRSLKLLRLLDRTQRLPLAIGLPARNQKGLSELIRQLYDPSSPNFGHYLTPAEFAGQFGPTKEDYEAVIDFVKAHGLTVTGEHPNRVVLDVEGAVTDVEKAFHITMRVYQHPTEHRTFFAPDTEPSVDLTVPLLHISGLSNYAITHPYYMERAAGVAKTAVKSDAMPYNGTGSGQNGSYAGGDFRAAYVPGTTLTGSGQSLGLVEFDTYYPSDIASYKSAFGLPDIPLINVEVDGGVSSPGPYNGEVCLDIEMSMAMAPGLSAIYVYTSPIADNNTNAGWDDLLSRMADDNICKQLSCSWGGETTDPAGEVILQQMATQGQSFFAASGDSDAYTASTNPVTFPSDSVNLTSVGGTTLTTSGTQGPYVSETVWNSGGGDGSSGGVTTNNYPIPSWQEGINMGANKGSTTLRNIPDVAMVANNVFVISNGGVDSESTGTSLAAPLWAGFTALVNQQAAASGRGPIGFLNPTIYAIGKGTSYGSAFHDITTGNNFSSNSPSKYSAVAGYDLCTGWGSPMGSTLINLIATPGDGLQITSGAYNVTGTMGGPFTSPSYTYTLVNTGTSAISWSGSNTQNWLALGQNSTQTSGTLAVSGSTTMAVGLNTNASSLSPGSYTDEITFADQTSGVKQLRAVNLDITAPAPAVSNNGNPTSLSGSGATLNGLVNPYGLTAMGWFEYGTTTSYGSTTRNEAADNAESYTAWNYGANSNGGTGLGPALYLEGTGGGIFLVNNNTGGQQIDGNNSFGISSGSGSQALCRQILSPASYGVLTFSARFDVSNSVGFSGFNLKASQGTHFSDGQLLSFGVTPSTGSNCIFIGGSATQYINLGSKILGPIIDFQVIWDTSIGTYQVGAKFRTSSSFINVTGNLDASGSNAAYFGAGTFNSGTNQNLIFDDLLFYTAPSLGSGNTNIAVSSSISGLSPATTYHFRTGGYSFSGISYAPDQAFVTPAVVPAAVTGSATGIFSWMATMNGTVNPIGSPTTWYFEFGTTTSYAFTSFAQSAGSGTSAIPVSFQLTGLQPGTLYNYRIVAVNAAGTTFGANQTFTTAAFVDTDDDGLPDDWEQYYFGGLGVNGSADPSGGGYTNLQNYVAGTNPLNTASQLRASIAVSGTTVQISFNSVAGELYQVQYATQLPNATWSTLVNNIGGNGAIITGTDTLSPTQRFYRVMVLP